MKPSKPEGLASPNATYPYAPVEHVEFVVILKEVLTVLECFEPFAEVAGRTAKARCSMINLSNYGFLGWKVLGFLNLRWVYQFTTPPNIERQTLTNGVHGCLKNWTTGIS